MRITYRLEKVKCGKKNCKSCPHGPYWYAYWTAGIMTRSKYIGKELPREVRESWEYKHAIAKQEKQFESERPVEDVKPKKKPVKQHKRR